MMIMRMMDQWALVLKRGIAYALDAFFLLRGLTGGSLPASAPVSLAGRVPGGTLPEGEGAGCESCICEDWPPIAGSPAASSIL